MFTTDMDWLMRMQPFPIDVLVSRYYEREWCVVENRCLTLWVLLVLLVPSLLQAAANEPHYIHNTLWKFIPYSTCLGFSDGVVYVCDEAGNVCAPTEGAVYTDFIFFALFYIPLSDDYPGYVFGFIPACRNVGKVVIYNYSLVYALRARLLKVSGDWVPEE